MDSYCAKNLNEAFGKWAEQDDFISMEDLESVLEEVPKNKRFRTWLPEAATMLQDARKRGDIDRKRGMKRDVFIAMMNSYFDKAAPGVTPPAISKAPGKPSSEKQNLSLKGFGLVAEEEAEKKNKRSNSFKGFGLVDLDEAQQELDRFAKRMKEPDESFKGFGLVNLEGDHGDINRNIKQTAYGNPANSMHQDKEPVDYDKEFSDLFKEVLGNTDNPVLKNKPIDPHLSKNFRVGVVEELSSDDDQDVPSIHSNSSSPRHAEITNYYESQDRSLVEEKEECPDKCPKEEKEDCPDKCPKEEKEDCPDKCLEEAKDDDHFDEEKDEGGSLESPRSHDPPLHAEKARKQNVSKLSLDTKGKSHMNHARVLKESQTPSRLETSPILEKSEDHSSSAFDSQDKNNQKRKTKSIIEESQDQPKTRSNGMHRDLDSSSDSQRSSKSTESNAPNKNRDRNVNSRANPEHRDDSSLSSSKSKGRSKTTKLRKNQTSIEQRNYSDPLNSKSTKTQQKKLSRENEKADPFDSFDSDGGEGDNDSVNFDADADADADAVANADSTVNPDVNAISESESESDFDPDPNLDLSSKCGPYTGDETGPVDDGDVESDKEEITNQLTHNRSQQALCEQIQNEKAGHKDELQDVLLRQQNEQRTVQNEEIVYSADEEQPVIEESSDYDSDEDLHDFDKDNNDPSHDSITTGHQVASTQELREKQSSKPSILEGATPLKEQLRNVKLKHINKTSSKASHETEHVVKEKPAPYLKGLREHAAQILSQPSRPPHGKEKELNLQIIAENDELRAMLAVTRLDLRKALEEIAYWQTRAEALEHILQQNL